MPPASGRSWMSPASGRWGREPPMNLFQRMFHPSPQPMQPLWDAIVAEGRREDWYLRHAVPDSVDGRFDMIAAVTALVMLRLERDGAIDATARLTERFTADMDGSLRQLGIGDMVIGKHMGKVLGALGGRIDGYRRALEPGAAADALVAALERNVYRGAPADAADPAGLAVEVRALAARIDALPLARLLAGELS